MKISFAVLALITVDASENLWKAAPHTDLIDLNTDMVHIRNIEKPHALYQKSPNEYGQVVDKTKFAYPYDPDVREAVARQQAQEEAFSVPSVRGINGRGMHAQMRTLPDAGAGAGGVAYEAGVSGLPDDEAIRESSGIFSDSTAWASGKSEVGGDPIVFSQRMKSPNEYGQVVDKTKFAYPYDPDVREAVARQQAQEEAFSVPSVRGINGRGMHAQLWKSPNEYGQVVDKTKFAYPYDPDVREAVARQQAQEEAFSVPSVRGINGRGMHAQMRTLPDSGAGAGGVAYEAGVSGLPDDEAIRESSGIFSGSTAWATGKSEVGGDPIVFSQRMKSPNEYGQVVDKTKFAYPYDPDVREAVARQQAQEEAFAVPSVRAINGRGM